MWDSALSQLDVRWHQRSVAWLRCGSCKDVQHHVPSVTRVVRLLTSSRRTEEVRSCHYSPWASYLAPFLGPSWEVIWQRLWDGDGYSGFCSSWYVETGKIPSGSADVRRRMVRWGSSVLSYAKRHTNRSFSSGKLRGSGRKRAAQHFMQKADVSYQ